MCFLSGAPRPNLSKARLREWSGVIKGANLRNANLRAADISWCHMDHVDLTGADLSDATFRDPIPSSAGTVIDVDGVKMTIAERRRLKNVPPVTATELHGFQLTATKFEFPNTNRRGWCNGLTVLTSPSLGTI